MSIFQVSRNKLAIYTQSISNIILISWLYNEYTHNIFMQQYLANLWASFGMAIAIGLSATGAAIIGISLFTRRVAFSSLSSSEPFARESFQSTALSPIETCPFCNSELRALSANRVQCRKCKRYFKK